MRFLFLLACLAHAAAAVADDVLVRTTEPLTAAEELAALTAPPGFENHLFAAEPQINKPINLAYDDRGRLWVSSTVEYPYAAKKERWADPQGTRVRDSRDAIKILEDTDGDGRADKVSDFADGLNIPTGVLPWHKPEHKDGCIAWSIPNIWYFADTTGDGRADKREVLFGPLGYERDTHGMCSSFRLGRDGWVYATHGFNNISTLKAKDGSSIELHSGNVFRFKPDGSSVEIFTRGQVNPFGLCFDRRGNLYSADCHSAPVYQLIQGATYPSFGNPHDGLGFAPAMIEHTHGSTGICGITLIDRDQWGSGWNNHLLIGNPVTSKINHDTIEFRGTTPVAIEQADFVTSKDPWFRPVDLCHGDDGALYVADFYNRIIGHYEVPLEHPGRDRVRGRIWKITRQGKTDTPEKFPAVEPIADPLAALESADAFTRRRAAAALQLKPQADALVPLLETLTNTQNEDTHLNHVLRLAVRNHLTAFPGAEFGSDPVRLGFIRSIAPAVPTKQAAALLASSPQRHDHLGHIARHADPAIIKEVIAGLRSSTDTKKQLRQLDALQAGLDERGQLEPNPDLLAWARGLATDVISARSKIPPSCWTALQHPDHPRSKPPWAHQPRKCGDGKQATVLSSLRIGEGKVEQRTGILRSEAFAAPETLSFWIVGHRGMPDQEAHQKNHFSLIKFSLIPSHAEEITRAYPPRSDIAKKITWKVPASLVGQPIRLQITDGDAGNAYAWLGVTRIEGAGAISVGSFSRSDEFDLAPIQPLLPFFPISLRDQLRPLLPATIPPVAPEPITEAERKALDHLIAAKVASYAKAKAGSATDPQRGAGVFKQHCAACHQIGGEGGLLGPQLDGVGTRGIGRLVEDIIDPNRNVDSHFYLTQFKLADGSEFGGFVLREIGQAIHIRDLAGNPRRLKLAEVRSRQTLPRSLMPADFGKSIAESDLHNLLAWLANEG